ncbi:ComEC/Rec2 family competence protein [Pacificimonas sp. WHA3]|uniref:ComEC/Rec2 family competence protein n=1 Tax=Pacificimonas pallii TaxID=2827236 RepID=A0ABS6SDS8_9SPHN|nr:ComEC/Rec2 family competence protein [Pacificimonas pallii]MBV7256558.1 ComEC/Rec2 family competence protein [Pacificimonas pallii]
MSSSSAARRIQTLAGWRISGLESWLAEERHQLPLFIPVFLGAGILSWFAIAGPGGWTAAICLALAFAMAGLLADGLIRLSVMAAGILFALGVALVWFHAGRVSAPVLDDSRFGVQLIGDVIAVERLPARERTRLLIAPDDDFPAGMRIRMSLRGDAPDGIGPGARVAMKATVSPPPGPSVPGGYHFARRAWFEGIGATGYALGGIEVVTPAPPPGGLSARLAELRANMTQRLQDGVGGRAGGVAAALVTGDRGGIQPEVSEAMRDSGLAHLIAISGLHIGVVVGGTLWLVRRALTLWPWFALRYDARLAAALVAALMGVAYTLIAGASVPTVRACIAVLIVLVGLSIGREAISLRLVAAGATAILIWRPDYVLSPSFQLSFAAVTGIVALYQSPWGRRWSAPDADRRWPAKMARGALALVLTGIVAEIAIGPIALFHFNQMGLYGAGANLIAIPLTSFVIIPLLMMSVLTGPFGLSAGPDRALGWTLDRLIDLAEATSALPGAVAMLPAMTGLAMVLIVAGGLWTALWQGRRRWFGVLPAGIGIVSALLTPRPDLLVSPDGTHLAIIDGSRIAMLRPRVGDYLQDMWGGAAGVRTHERMEERADTDCSRDACQVRLARGGRDWNILATRSRNLIGRAEFETACRRNDIVVSARRLPDWCRPRWLRLGRAELERLGAVSIDLKAGAIRSAAAEDGAHPWSRRTASDKGETGS